jgi:hypothetical protein
MAVRDKTLSIEVDLSVELHDSKSGRTVIISRTDRFVAVPGMEEYLVQAVVVRKKDPSMTIHQAIPPNSPATVSCSMCGWRSEYRVDKELWETPEALLEWTAAAAREHHQAMPACSTPPDALVVKIDTSRMDEEQRLRTSKPS